MVPMIIRVTLLSEKKRIKKRYTFLSLIIICSMVLVFNLILSSSSKTNIVRPGFSDLDKPVLNHQNIYIHETRKLSKPEYLIKTGSIKNKPVYCEFKDQGLSSLEILELSKDFKKVFDFRKARKGDKYTLYFSRKNNKLKKIEYKRNLLTQYIAKKNNSGKFDVEKKKILLKKKIIAKEFILDGSLFHTILSGGEGYSLACEFTDIFSWDIDFFLFPRKGDKIKIEFEKLSKDGNFVKYGKILAAQYIAKDKTFSAFLFDNGKYQNYYDEKGNPLRKMFLRVPIKSGHMTSPFSLRRFHPIDKKWKRHTGIDYGSSTGTPIFATANGKVKFAGWSTGYGKLVIVVHPNGYETYYGHCSKLLVKPGKYVNQGEVIARVGSTGHATGPHVHYEVRINRKPINPNCLKSSPGKPLADKFIAEYKNLVRKRLDTLNSNIQIASSKIKLQNKS